MGGAASLRSKSGSIPATVFLTTEVIEGCSLLNSDELLAKSFVEYVKSGAWLDRIAHYVPEDISAITETFSFHGKSAFENVSLPSNPSEKSEVGGSSKKSAGDVPGSSKSGQSSQMISLDEAYAGMAESLSSFSASQLSCMLFAVAFPHFLASSTYRRHLKYGAQAARHAEEESNSISSHSVAVPAGAVQTPHSARAQEMLLACAAYFDGGPMLQLVRNNWAEDVSSFLSAHAFAISVVDTSKVGFPFMYVNKRFESLFGYRSDDILGKPQQVLYGEKTEPSKKARLLFAFKSQLCTKLYITRYTSTGRAVLDVVAVQPVGGLAVCVHFGTGAAADADPLRMVDDLLTLIACLIRKPTEVPPSPLPSALYRQTSWFGPLQMSPQSAKLASLPRQASWFGPRALPSLKLNVSLDMSASITSTLPFLLRAVHSPVGLRASDAGKQSGGEISVVGADRLSARSNHSGGSRGRGSVRSHGLDSHSGCSGSGSGPRAGEHDVVRSFHSVVSGAGYAEAPQRAMNGVVDA